MIDSWLEPVWQSLLRAREQQRLPHAILMQGSEGIGKLELVHQFAQLMLCSETAGAATACGQCQSCRLFASQTHPDFLQIQPEEVGKAIKIDQIRQMAQELSMTSHSGGYKIAAIAPAEGMNINAANSLLKTLEEPTDNTLIMLVSARPTSLPITVRSRCQALICPTPTPAVAKAWLSQTLPQASDSDILLALANGAPHLARALHETGAVERWSGCLEQLGGLAEGRLDPLSVAAQWNKQEGKQALEWFMLALQKLIRSLESADQTQPDRLTQILPVKGQALDTRRLFVVMDAIGYAINHWSSGLNTHLLIEDILICWAALFKRMARAAG